MTGGNDAPVEMRHCRGCGENYNAFEESHVGHDAAGNDAPTCCDGWGEVLDGDRAVACPVCYPDSVTPPAKTEGGDK